MKHVININIKKLAFDNRLVVSQYGYDCQSVIAAPEILAKVQLVEVRNFVATTKTT